MRLVVRIFVVVAVVASSARAQAPVCQRPCLAPPVIAGAAPDERVAIEGALLRTLGVERCVAADFIDEACFDDDTCLLGRPATDAGVIGARGVVVAGQLSVRLAAIREAHDSAARGVQRATIEQPLLGFLANGRVDEALASCAVSAAPVVQTPPVVTTKEPPPTTTEATASTVPWRALSIGGIVTGGVLFVVGGVAAIGGATALQRDLDSDVEKAAEAALGVGGAAGIVGLLVGTASVVALIVMNSDEPPQD